MARTRLPERWATIARNPLYEVSDHGRVRSNARGKRGYVLTPGPAKSGHLTVSLQGRTEYVHVLVAEAFIGFGEPGQEVRHADGKHGNNFWTNLAWTTRGRNTQDKKHHAGQKGRLKIEQVRIIKRKLAEGGKGVDLAREFGVGQTAISAIKHGHNHAEVIA